MSTPHVQDARGRRLSLQPALTTGGEATVYPVVEHPQLVAKVYHRPTAPTQADKLAWMISHPLTVRRGQHPGVAWPQATLHYQDGRLAGYLMPRVADAVQVVSVYTPLLRQRISPDFSWQYLHRTARNLAAAFEAVHTAGYIVGDVNERNVLVSRGATVTLVDADSFQVRATHQGRTVVHTCPVARPEYLAPERRHLAPHAPRSEAEDLFGLAVLIFQVLMDGSHPFRARWVGSGEPAPLHDRVANGWFPHHPQPRGPVAPPPQVNLAHLHPPLVAMLRRCFHDGHTQPTARPRAADWRAALDAAEAALVTCTNGHIFSNHQRACPRCNARQRPSAATPGARSPSAPAAPVSRSADLVDQMEAYAQRAGDWMEAHAQRAGNQMEAYAQRAGDWMEAHWRELAAAGVVTFLLLLAAVAL